MAAAWTLSDGAGANADCGSKAINCAVPAKHHVVFRTDLTRSLETVFNSADLRVTSAVHRLDSEGCYAACDIDALS